MKVVQNSFAGGELSPAMWGRIDDNKYQAGLAECLNFICRPEGPVENRSGFEFVRAAKYSNRKCRLIPFVFTADQTMVVELGHKYARFHTMGATVLKNGNPYEISTPYSADDVMDIHYAQSADVVTLVHPKYAPRELRRYGATDWRLVTIDFQPALPAPTNLGGTFVCNADDDYITEESKTMYTFKYVVTAVVDSDDGIKESQASAVASVVGNLFLESSKITLVWNAVAGAARYRVYKTLSGVFGYIGETADTTFVDDNISADQGITPPRWDDAFLTSGGIESVTVVAGGSGYDESTRGIAAPSTLSFVNADGSSYSGSHPEKFSRYEQNESGTYPAPNYPVITGVVLDRTGTGSGGTVSITVSNTYTQGTQEPDDSTVVYWTDSLTTVTGVTVVTAGSGYTTPMVRLYEDGVATDRYIPLERTSGTSTTLTVVDSNGSGAVLTPFVEGGEIVSVTITNPGSGYVAPRVVVNSQTGTGARITADVPDTGDYPGAVGYYEQRRIFAGTQNRPQFVWMTRPGTEYDLSYTLPTQSDNRIKFRLATNESSRIRHVVPMQSLLLLTAGAEFRVTTANDDAITPESVGVKAQSYIGSNNVQPVIANSTVCYASNRGGHMRELGYNWQASGYVTGDMSIRAAHLFDGKGIVDLALAKAPYSVVWAVNNAGELLGCTYIPEQQIGGWHRHTTRNGSFESVACVAEGGEDALYAVVKRKINGSTVRYIERMHERMHTTLADSFFVDCGVTFSSTTAVTTISGLSHLEGQTVAILADGKVLPRQTVSNGTVTLPTAALKVQIGLPIDARLRTLPVILQVRDGGYGRGLKKNVERVFLQCFISSGVKVGPELDYLADYTPRDWETYATPPDPETNEIEVLVRPDWTTGGQVYVVQDNPLPLTVCSLTAVVDT